jgi:hypothetical protein
LDAASEGRAPLTISPSRASAKWPHRRRSQHEWSFIQQQTKKTNVPVSIAHDMTLLKEVQRELGM